MKYNYLKLQALGARFDSVSAGHTQTDEIKALCIEALCMYMCAEENSHYQLTKSLRHYNLVSATEILKGFTPALKCKIQKVINMAIQLYQKID